MVVGVVEDAAMHYYGLCHLCLIDVAEINQYTHGLVVQIMAKDYTVESSL